MKKNNKRSHSTFNTSKPKNRASADEPVDSNNLEDQEQEQEVSKSELKREMHRLQDLGKELLKLKTDDLNALQLSDPLVNALEEARRIKHREGLRRQMQFIGKLMRKESDEAIGRIEALFERLANQHRVHTQQQHLIEQWRDKMLADGTEIERFLEQYPDADRQWLRQITRQSAQETQRGKPPAAARKLFAYIRDTLAGSL